MLVSFSIILIIEFILFLTSIVSKICCFSEIVADICEAILSAIWEGSFNCLIVFVFIFYRKMAKNGTKTVSFYWFKVITF